MNILLTYFSIFSSWASISFQMNWNNQCTADNLLWRATWSGCSTWPPQRQRFSNTVRPYWKKNRDLSIDGFMILRVGDSQLEETDFTARYIFLLTGGYCTFLIRYTFLVRLCFFLAITYVSGHEAVFFFGTLRETIAIEWPTCQRIPLLSAFQPEISCSV